MSLDQRSKVIDAFSGDPSVRVFLMSLKAGGVALNLTAASHVMLRGGGGGCGWEGGGWESTEGVLGGS